VRPTSANVTGTLFIRVSPEHGGRARLNGELCGLPEDYHGFDDDDEVDD
jgi:hypothetical protein